MKSVHSVRKSGLDFSNPLKCFEALYKWVKYDKAKTFLMVNCLWKSIIKRFVPQYFFPYSEKIKWSEKTPCSHVKFVLLSLCILKIIFVPLCLSDLSETSRLRVGTDQQRSSLPAYASGPGASHWDCDWHEERRGGQSTSCQHLRWD